MKTERHEDKILIRGERRRRHLESEAAEYECEGGSKGCEDEPGHGAGGECVLQGGEPGGDRAGGAWPARHQEPPAPSHHTWLSGNRSYARLNTLPPIVPTISLCGCCLAGAGRGRRQRRRADQSGDIQPAARPVSPGGLHPADWQDRRFPRPRPRHYCVLPAPVPQHSGRRGYRPPVTADNFAELLQTEPTTWPTAT